MAQIWTQEAGESGWMARPLTGDVYAVSEQGSSLREDDGGCGHVATLALVVRCGNGCEEDWLLLSPKRARVQVNGGPMVLGIRLLCDRDEIVAGADAAAATFRGFFTTERLPCVVAYPGGNGTLLCPRCKLPIERNQMAVRCPNAACGAWHHEETNLACWTYARTCALCNRPTQLDAGFNWTPEDL